MSAKSSQGLGPTALASAAVTQQNALLKDAQGRLDVATSARVAAEAAVAAAEQAHGEALAASAAKRTDDDLADQAAREGVRLVHARSDHRAALEAHGKATSDVKTAEGRLESATRAHELAGLLEQLDDPSTDAELRSHGEACADALIALRGRILSIRAVLQKDRELVQRARELGATDVQARDGIAAASGWLAGLAGHGGALGNGAETHDHRFAFALPAPDHDPNGFDAVRNAVVAGSETIAQGIRFDRAGVPYGRERLEAVAAAWVGHRTARSAHEALAAVDRKAAAARDQEHKLAHDKRLEQAAEKERRGRANARTEVAARNEEAVAAQKRIDLRRVDGVETWSTGDGEVSIAPGEGPRRTWPTAIPPNPLLTVPDEPKV